MTLVKDMYDSLALKTGFPVYTNDTDCPDINRFLLEMISEGLQSTIDNLYISNNVLERNDTIKTIPNKNNYGIEGLIKNIQIQGDNGCYDPLPYNDYANPNDLNEEFGRPESYVIKNGYLKLLPTPDAEYTIKICVSTTDLVMSDDDTSRTSVTHINDSIMASDRFCDLVVLKAAGLTFARLQNATAEIYAGLYEARLKTFLEHDIGTIEAQRGHIRGGGHYDSRFGLIDDEPRHGGYFD